jgi:tetratricopeptide (TPR) repeat protein
VIESAIESASESKSVSKAASLITGAFKKLSLAHIFLLVNVLAIVAVLVTLNYFPLRGSADASNPGVQGDIESGAKPKQPSAKVIEAAPVAVEKPQAASWTQARTAYANRKYAAALSQYTLLNQIARNSPEPDMVSEFFQLRMAQCYEQLVQPQQAQKLFQIAAVGKSPVIRGVANYHLAMSHERAGRYSQAKRRAYLAAAALAGLSERLALETNCDFLIARTLTASALSFYGKAESVSWDNMLQADPMVGLDEGQLRTLLNDGVKTHSGAVLSPKIYQDKNTRSDRWTLVCKQTPLRELLNRFATDAQSELRWVAVDTAVQNRPMTLHIRRVGGQKLCELAAGSAGLIVRFTGQEIDIYDPAGCDSLKQQRDLLVSEAMVVWRRLFLRLPRDDRIGQGHFTMALLQECSGDVTGAIGQYRTMAKKFANARLAPDALLAGAKLRIALRDFSGARKELLTLLDTYPGSSKSAETYASLGEATLNAGRADEAFAVFKKLFFLNHDNESKRLASFGAGKCLYQQGEYEKALKWLGDHITFTKKDQRGDLSRAYLLLGKCYAALGSPRQAIASYKAVLATRPSEAQRIETSLALAGAWRDGGDLPKALGASLQVVAEVPSGAKKYQAMLITSGIYREMGLPNRGAVFINSNINEVRDRDMRAKLRIDQARCYRDAKRFADAYAILVKAPEMLSPGKDAQQAACDLADVCLRLDRPGQAAVVAAGVLKSSKTGPHHKRARGLLVEAYLAKKEYENAATVLSGIQMDKLGAKQ